MIKLLWAMGMFRSCGAEEIKWLLEQGVKKIFSYPVQGVKNALGEQNIDKNRNRNWETEAHK